jgi:hypothetical protein
LIRLSSLNVWLKNNQPQQLEKDALRRMLTLQLLCTPLNFYPWRASLVQKIIEEKNQTARPPQQL